MRTIRFRGKCAKDSRYAGEWVEGGVLQCEKSDDVLITSAITDTCSCTYHVDPDTVGHYTGLTNKIGTPIYEGDILKMGNCDFRGVVQWHKNGYFYINEYYPKVIDDDYSPLGNMLRYDMDVIGNVFDNPELMKGGE